jgi:hypothetical protein
MLFDDAERPELLANYTPSVAPRWDGGHLISAWAMMRDMSLFWPWYNRTKSGVLTRDAAIGAEFVDSRVQDLFKIGDAYRNAYAASFTYPMAAKLKALKVPCLMVDHPGGGSYSRLAMAKDIAPHLQIADLPDAPAQWPTILDPFFAS